jgi:phosphotransferase system HPr-like phosphotransfer protein
VPEVEHDDAVVLDPATRVSEQEFLPLLRRRVEPLLVVYHLVQRIGDSSGDRARSLCTDVRRLVTEFVFFLEDHGARGNRLYSALAEYAAGVRGFANMGRHLTHMEARLGDELPLPASTDGGETLRADVTATFGFVREALQALTHQLFEEIQRVVNVPVPLDTAPLGLGEPDVGPRLPQDLGEESVPQKERWISEIASKFLAHKEVLDRQSQVTEWVDPDAMRTFVLEVSDEQQVRFFCTRIHNLLSRYDTYIRGTSVEGLDPSLPLFRRHVVITLHVLEVMIELVHFYERHENEVRCEQVKNRIAELVDKQRVLDCILNFCLNHLHRYMEKMAPLAEDLVRRYTRQTRIHLTIPEGVHLHARPVSLLTRIVNHYGTPVHMSVGETVCYAGSILEVLMAVGSNPGVRDVTFEGDDKPLADLARLFELGLGESDNPLPADLSYLRR